MGRSLKQEFLQTQKAILKGKYFSLSFSCFLKFALSEIICRSAFVLFCTDYFGKFALLAGWLILSLQMVIVML